MSAKPSVDAVALPDECTPGDLEGKIAVVIDVLRASTTIIAAIGSGAVGVIPKRTIESARACAGERSGALLGGERSAVKVEGFDLGNSPLEYTPKAVAGRTVVLSTTNGTRAIELSGGADTIYIGALTNRAAHTELLMGQQRDVVLVCSGTDGRVSEEDCFCAGMIAEVLGGWGILSERARIMRDNARAALDTHGDCGSVLLASFHGQRISKLGLDSDIRAAAMIDSSRCVPVLNEGGMLVAAG